MKIRIIILLTIFIYVFTGCGTNQQEQTAAEETDIVRSERDWRTEKWKFDTLSATAQHELYLTEYAQGLEYENDEFFSALMKVYSCYDHNFYELDRFIQDTLTQDIYLNCYDGESRKIWHQQISLPVWKEYQEYKLSPENFEMLNSQEYILFFAAYNQENVVMAYLAAHMNLEGECLSVVDLYPVMQDHGLSILDHYAYNKAYADQQGYFYLLSDYGLTGLGAGEILIIDSDGKFVNRIGSEGQESEADYVMKDPDGNAVFELYNAQTDTMELIGYHAADGIRQYAEVQLEKDTPKVMSADGYVYYGTEQGKLYRWDLYTGTREFCMDYRNMGITANALMLNSDGEPVLIDYSTGEVQIYQLGSDPEETKETIQMVSLTPDCQYASRCAIDYSRNNDYVIRVDKPSAEGLSYQEMLNVVEDYRTRAMADLVAGKGADIYYVSAEDMEMLYEKGALADLSDVLPEEYTEAIFPGALACGVIDGKQIGLAPEGHVSIVLADNDLWTGDHWSLSEAFELQKRNSQREYLLVYRIRSGTVLETVGKLTIFRDRFLFNLEDSPFLDLEEGTCDFTNSCFTELLEMIKNEEGCPNYEVDAIYEKETIAFAEDLNGFAQFTYIMSEYGDQYHLVGFPTENACGNYWKCQYYVVVNKNTEHWEQVKEYLISLFEYDRQRSSDTNGPVRNDLIEGNLYYDETNPYHKLLYNSGDGWIWIYEKPEGGTWDKEYIELLNSCQPYRNRTREIENIIMEEADSYFSGNKDVETVTELIQNRVQLYLNEHK